MQLIHLLGSYGFIPAAKAVMALLGVPVGPARLPNVSLTSNQITRLRIDLEMLGYFGWLDS